MHDPQKRGTWYQGTSISHPPDLQGQGREGGLSSRGRAWRIDLDEWRKESGRKQRDGTVSAYIVHSPGSHVAWDHYLFSITHLRDVDGITPPVKHYPDATHEALIVALDPRYPLPDPKRFRKLNFFQPADFMEQCKVPDDVKADQLLETLVILAIDGLLTPDVDYQEAWTAALWVTAKKLCQGEGEKVH